MGRVIVGLGPRVRPLSGERTATVVELDDGQRLHIQLYDDGQGPHAKVSRMKWRGLVPAETLFDDEDVLYYFARLGPQEMEPPAFRNEFLRRLTEIILRCSSLADARAVLANLDAAGLYDNERWV